MNAGAQALLSAKLGGEDFFGYFLSHKKVTLSARRKDGFIFVCFVGRVFLRRR
jgi:hypothetical protein